MVASKKTQLPKLATKSTWKHTSQYKIFTNGAEAFCLALTWRNAINLQLRGELYLHTFSVREVLHTEVPLSKSGGLKCSFSGCNQDPDILKSRHLAGRNKHAFSDNLIIFGLEVHDCYILTVLPLSKPWKIKENPRILK